MPFDFSSDLDVGRRPELKSDEKSKGIPIVLEISRCDFFAFFIYRYTLSEHHSMRRIFEDYSGKHPGEVAEDTDRAPSTEEVAAGEVCEAIPPAVALAGFFRKDTCNRKKDPLEGKKNDEKRPGTRKFIEEMRGTNNLSAQSLLPDGSLTAVM